jgi:AraC family transcriptional regulator
MNQKSSQSLRNEYMSRINRVIDFIEQHIHEEIRLSIMAEIANFSKFHFHRIFLGITGETLNAFIQRLRLEKAATLLLTNHSIPITQIALNSGFASSATFARAFKEKFKMSASDWRSKYLNKKSNLSKAVSNSDQLNSKTSEDVQKISFYIDPVTNNQIWRVKRMDKSKVNVEVKELQEMTVAYVRHIGPYKGDSALFERMFTKLFKWAGARDLLNIPETKTIAVYHDNPGITDDSKLRTSMCITVPATTEIDGEVGKMNIEGGKYALGHFELNVDEYEQAWKIVYGDWLPQSGYQPDDKPCFEIYHNDPETHPEKKHIVDICIPIKPM